MPFFDQAGKRIAGVIGEERGKGSIEALAIVFGRNDGSAAIAHAVRVTSIFSFVCLKLD